MLTVPISNGTPMTMKHGTSSLQLPACSVRARIGQLRIREFDQDAARSSTVSIIGKQDFRGSVRSGLCLSKAAPWGGRLNMGKTLKNIQKATGQTAAR